MIKFINEEEQFDARFKLLFICYAISLFIFIYISIKEVLLIGV